MAEDQPGPAALATAEAIAECPVNHSYFSGRKTAQVPEPAGCPVEQTDDGVWHIRDYDLAKQILRGPAAKQAGFKVELADQMPGMEQKPVLFQDGPDHQSQRRQIARFFTPKTTSQKYRTMMENYADTLVAGLDDEGQIDLSDVSLKMAVRVAAQVVGLTNSRSPGMAGRLDSFLRFDPGEGAGFSWRPEQLGAFLKTNYAMLAFYLLDVRPAIQARRKKRQEDVISHLLDQEYKDREILMECVTYGAAGMATTREFILTASWHLLENPELARIYLSGTEDERHDLMREILRLEPVVSNLYRRATANIELLHDGRSLIIPEGALIDLHIYGINSDPTVVGEAPGAICPGRPLEKRAQPPVMAFGDGHHRCPGAFIAIQETDIFLRRLFAVDGLRLVREPTVDRNELIKGYEIRNFVVAASA
ncbi:MAG: cytochrome P450 [Chloroflexota bacterium]|nr:MAG: cytochrome P450 [Chloroflexota bacterium]